MNTLRKLKATFTLKHIIFIVVVCLLGVALFAMILTRAKIPMQYDEADNPQIYLVTEIHHDYIDQGLWNNGFGYRNAFSKGKISELRTNNLARVNELTGETYDVTMGYSNLILLNYYGRDNIYHISRNISRKDESVTVVYFYYSTNLADSFNYSLPKYDSPIPDTVSLTERKAGNEHKMAEIYYLPADFGSFEEFCDESYYAEKDNGVLVWSGMI